MSNKSFLFLLLMSCSINSSADENLTPIEDAKTQPSPVTPSAKRDVKSTANKQPTGRELMQQSFEIARLAAEIDRKRELYAKGPKRKYIFASTQEPEYVAYMKVFARKLEDAGNANYPEEFRRKNISGRVIVTVSIGRDGTVEEVLFNSFSSEKPAVISIIKDVVLKAVTASAPFAPLPETKEKIDFLHITRTWDFGGGDLERF